MNSENKHPFHDPSLNKRHRASQRFFWFARASLIFAIAFLTFFLFDIIGTAIPAYQQTYLLLDVDMSEKYSKSSLLARRAVDRKYRKLVSRAWLRDLPKLVKKHPQYLGTKQELWVLADDQVDQYMKEHHNTLSGKNLNTLKILITEDKVDLKFNTVFFSHGDSKIPEYSGFLSAMVGSILTMIITMVVAFPIGTMTAIYLEEFSKDNKWTQLIEININNLAAIPSILFGLLGLAVFINLFGMPRSSPLVGGLTLALMTLPIIIVSSRAVLRSVPDKIRQAGYGLGLTKIQVTRDHVLPIAFPGMMTGAIIGLAQAIGETAPLIIVGMIAFIPDAPNSFFEAATVMPAQIYTWAGMPEKAYVERTAAGIVTLLTVLVTLNGLAIYLRKKFEIKY